MTTVRIAAALAVCLIASAEETIYVGILEPQVLDTPVRVRVAFQFLNGRWRAMPHDASGVESLSSLPKLYPARLAWTVALDGKKVGAVNSVQPASYKLYADVGVQDLTPDSKPPAVRGSAAAFQTWLGASHFRPLVAISKPNFSDLDHWKPIRPLPLLGKEARAAFRKAVALDLSCSDKAVRDYPDEYIQLRKAYRSDRGDVLLGLRANPAKNSCGMNDGAWDSVWFLVRNGDFHLIGTELALVDAGDYSGGGTSEVIFHLSAYNRDGYVLLDLRDLSKAEFDWSYH